MMLPVIVDPTAGVESTTCCLLNYRSVQTGAIVTLADRIGTGQKHQGSGHVRTEIPALDGVIDNEIDNTLLSANVLRKSERRREYPWNALSGRWTRETIAP
jgi:hypothetical protein